MLVQRKGCSAQITEEDLEQIDLALYRFHDVFSGTLAQFMPSQGKTVKYHKMSHITSTIRRFGHIKHVSSQTYDVLGFICLGVICLFQVVFLPN